MGKIRFLQVGIIGFPLTTLTVFGYSAPVSDAGAVTLLRDSWFARSDRQFEHMQVIDRPLMPANALHERWTSFLPTGHLRTLTSFDASWLSMWPRRSNQALLHSMSEGLPCETFPLPQTSDLQELQGYVSTIAAQEAR